MFNIDRQWSISFQYPNVEYDALCSIFFSIFSKSLFCFQVKNMKNCIKGNHMLKYHKIEHFHLLDPLLKVY